MGDYFMAKSPHTPEFRAKVSQEYLDGVGSYDFISAKYSIGSKTLRQWISKYRIYGIAAFAHKFPKETRNSGNGTINVQSWSLY